MPNALNLCDLERRAGPPPTGAPSGPLAPFLGRRIPSEELWAAHSGDRGYDEAEQRRYRPLAARVHAFEVAALLGASVTCEGEADLEGALQRLLARSLPGATWAPPLTDGGSVARLRQYLFVHESLAAEPCTPGGEPMALELLARVRDAEALPEANRWMDDSQPLVLPIVLEVEAATWANVRFPGIGIPLYL